MWKTRVFTLKDSGEIEFKENWTEEEQKKLEDETLKVEGDFLQNKLTEKEFIEEMIRLGRKLKNDKDK